MATATKALNEGGLVAVNVLVAGAQYKERQGKTRSLADLVADVEALEDSAERKALRAAIAAARRAGGSTREAARLVLEAHARSRGQLKAMKPLLSWAFSRATTPATC